MVRTILCIDGGDRTAALRRAVLQSSGYRVFTADEPSLALAVMAEEPVDCVVVNRSFLASEAEGVMSEIRRRHPAMPVVMLDQRASASLNEMPDRLCRQTTGRQFFKSIDEVLGVVQ